MKSIAIIATCLAAGFASGADCQVNNAQDKPSAPASGTDPSTMRGRPDANYPRPSGQDAKTDAAARPHAEQGHDHAADANHVPPAQSAGPNGKDGTYTGASGKKPDAAKCSDTAAPTQKAPSTTAEARTTPGCADAKKPSATAAKVPPGATAPMRK